MHAASGRFKKPTPRPVRTRLRCPPASTAHHPAGSGETSAATGDLNIKDGSHYHRRHARRRRLSTATVLTVCSWPSLPAALTLNDLTVQNGYPGAAPGGCILTLGVNLTLTRVVVKSCQADAAGGGIVSSGRSSDGNANGHDDFAERGNRIRMAAEVSSSRNGVVVTMTRATISGTRRFSPRASESLGLQRGFRRPLR